MNRGASTLAAASSIGVLSIVGGALACGVAALSLVACGSSQQHAQGAAQTPLHDRETPASEPADAGAPGTSSADAAVAPDASGEPLPERVDGGEIPRAILFAVLQRGVARFLQQVRAEPHLEQGRFIGWRVVGLFPSADSQLHSNVVQAGDTVLRVNGQSIERPEQFKNVWDSMATSSELVLLVRRGQRESTVRYRIVE